VAIPEQARSGREAWTSNRFRLVGLDSDPRVAFLRRSSLVDIGLALAQTVPATGRVASVPVGCLIQH
jgi:hypothetical protein